MQVAVCPGQELTSVTYPLANSSDKTQQPGEVITQSGVMKYTVYVKKGFHCASDIKIIVNNQEIEMRNATFSKLLTWCLMNSYVIILPFKVLLVFKTVMLTLTTPPVYFLSVHLPSTQQHQGLY